MPCVDFVLPNKNVQSSHARSTTSSHQSSSKQTLTLSTTSTHPSFLNQDNLYDTILAELSQYLSLSEHPSETTYSSSESKSNDFSYLAIFAGVAISVGLILFLLLRRR